MIFCSTKLQFRGHQNIQIQFRFFWELHFSWAKLCKGDLVAYHEDEEIFHKYGFFKFLKLKYIGFNKFLCYFICVLLLFYII